MSQNYGNRHVSAEKWAAIHLAYENFQQEVEDALSPMAGDHRQRVVRMGDGSVAFVEKAIEVAKQNQDLLRRGFDLDELQRDIESRKQLHALELKMTQSLEQVHNAVVAHGSDAMAGGLEIYAAVKDDDGEGASGLRKLLGKRFVRGGHKDASGPAAS